MEHLLSNVPEYALGAGMVTAIGYIFLQLIKSYGNLGNKWKEYAEYLEKENKELRKNK